MKQIKIPMKSEKRRKSRKSKEMPEKCFVKKKQKRRWRRRTLQYDAVKDGFCECGKRGFYSTLENF